jgi:opacity protein-like surface antigen
MKVLIASLLVLSLTTTSYGQRAKESIGPRAGVVFSTFSYDPAPPSSIDVGMKTGFALGMEFNHWFNSSFALAPQLFYIQKGGNHTIEAGNVKFEEAITASYIEIPVYVKFAIGDNDTRPYVFAGPALSVMLAADDHLSGGGQDTTASIKDQFTSNDFSFNLGAGLSTRLNMTTELVIDAGYSLGLTDVAKDRSNGATGKAFINNIRLMAALLFRI